MSSFKTFLFSISFFFFTLRVTANITICRTARCDGSLEVHFPFRLKNHQSSRCAYDGRTGRFDLACNKRNQTVIRFGSGSEFSVDSIKYEEQSISINDPDDCLPRRYLNKEFNNFTSETFAIEDMESYTFLNCSSKAATLYYHFVSPISCLGGGEDRTVVAMPTAFLMNSQSAPPPSSSLNSDSPAPAPATVDGCLVMGIAQVAVSLQSVSWLTNRFSDLSNSVRLTWSDPDCRECLARDGECGFRSSSTSEIGCFLSSKGSSTGLSRGAKYGITVGVGIPGLICIIGLASYICGRIRACGRRRRPYSDNASADTPEPVVVLLGFDRPTIESFPKIELGESKRLPKPSDNTCPICLSEYQPKETLRTIPECNHYFHANCVDEWLKMNATCPVCRNSPDGTSSRVSPSTSVSVSSSNSLLSSP
ncbi:RING-H2 finger protein ATL22 [Morus notabilis]|uniref:RING-H2 finger protein ATL22 n=1 Tax=Morus notabilis TaxID=981085 RepID=W9QMH5_9ROSA|nr:RING-H2 finger protein ATL20 [Morus notabilis]EXB28670.1 RING-H2 finger protein ATL22 [Morus notabilis]